MEQVCSGLCWRNGWVSGFVVHHKKQSFLHMVWGGSSFQEATLRSSATHKLAVQATAQLCNLGSHFLLCRMRTVPPPARISEGWDNLYQVNAWEACSKCAEDCTEDHGAYVTGKEGGNFLQGNFWAVTFQAELSVHVFTLDISFRKLGNLPRFFLWCWSWIQGLTHARQVRWATPKP